MDVCCAAGAPVSIAYTPQGSFQELGGVNCYVTGDSKDVAIIGIYDIFGFSAQVFVACSIHRASTCANHGDLHLLQLCHHPPAAHHTHPPCRHHICLSSGLVLLLCSLGEVQAGVICLQQWVA